MALPYEILLVPDEKDFWFAEIPLLKRCQVNGESAENAIWLIEKAKRKWFINAFELQLPIPEPPTPAESATLEPQVKKLLEKIKLGVDNEANEALIQLVYILERSTFTSTNIEAFIQPDLRNVRVSYFAQRLVVDELLSLIMSGHNLQSSLLWAIGKAHPYVALKPLLRWIKHATNLDRESAYQTVIALQNCLQGIILDFDKNN